MNEIKTIQAALGANGLPAYDIYQIDNGEVVICISWGDWKHDHLACECIMKRLGWHKEQEIITEDNGSDCYSSEHTYIKNNN